MPLRTIMTERGFTSHGWLCFFAGTQRELQRSQGHTFTFGVWYFFPHSLQQPCFEWWEFICGVIVYCSGELLSFSPRTGGLIRIPLNTSIYLGPWRVCMLCKGQQRNAESQVSYVNPHVLSQKTELGSLVNPLSFTHYRSQINICYIMNTN